MSKFKIALLIIGGILIVVVALTPKYVVKALVYQLPGIDDMDIFTSNTIETAQPIPWATAKNYNQAKLSSAENDSLIKYDPVAFLVIQNDSILYESYWDGYSAQSTSNSFSVAKSVMSLLVGTAIDDGFIKDVNQPVCDFIPSFKEDDRAKITIKHLLTMSSGLNWIESYSSIFCQTTQAYYGDDLTELVADLKAVEEPGRICDYKSGDTQLLALVLRKATGKTISEYASEKLWKPLGAENPAYWSLDKKDGVEKAYCCIYSNARDYARLGSLILHQGAFNGKQIVSKEYIEASATPSTFLTDIEDKQSVDFYGYLWWIMNYKNNKIVYSRGILGQYIIAIPDKNLVVVRLGNLRSDSKFNHHPLDVYNYIDLALNLTLK